MTGYFENSIPQSARTTKCVALGNFNCVIQVNFREFHIIWKRTLSISRCIAIFWSLYFNTQKTWGFLHQKGGKILAGRHREMEQAGIKSWFIWRQFWLCVYYQFCRFFAFPRKMFPGSRFLPLTHVSYFVVSTVYIMSGTRAVTTDNDLCTSFLQFGPSTHSLVWACHGSALCILLNIHI